MPHPGDVAVPVPYTSKLGQKILPGQTLNVHGTVHEDAKSAAINLLAGSPEINEHMGEAVLHINLRFDEKKIVMNTFTGGAWGKEERESLHFKKGEKFDLKVRVLEECMEITCDGKKIHEFKHRLPFSIVEFFQVKGDVSLSGVHWGGRFYDIPYETGFPNGGLQAGQRIFITGFMKGNSWSCNLLAANGDILFHFNPRLKEKKIVRNSCKNDMWGEEEREGPFPFHKERAFDVTVLNEPYSIQLFVNDERVGTFQHRCANPVGDYIGMKIDGEVEITGIEFSH